MSKDRGADCWTREGLRERGIGKRKLKTMLADGSLHRVHRNIYIQARPTPTRVALALLAGLAGVALSGRSAMQVVSGRALTFPLELEGPRTIVGKNFRVRHSRMNGVCKFRDMKIIEPLYAARRVPPETQEGFERYYATPRGKHRFEQDVSRCKRVTKKLRTLLKVLSIGADTQGERDLASALRKHGHKVEHNVTGGQYRFDLFLPKYRLIIEIDGWEYHNSGGSFEKDRWKSLEANAEGFIVLRVSANSVKYYSRRVIDVIERTISWIRAGYPARQLTTFSGNPAFRWNEFAR
ncbi:MAG: DUF559 domain-containing protein [Corynebacterium sp.]|nr:DUF559 domain-containing protein [Corynebacterium sp.]